MKNSRRAWASWIAGAICAVPTACGPVVALRDVGTDGVADGGAGVRPVGSFKVQLNPPGPMAPGATVVVGRVQDGPSPAAIQWARSMSDGDCACLLYQSPSPRD